MRGEVDFVAGERARAARWKERTPTLEDADREPARWCRDGVEVGPSLPFCLPRASAARNLLPEVRDEALALFAELGIPWHQGVDGGPGNHLLSSQVQCVNALGPMVHDPARVVRAFGPIVGTAEVLEVEPGRYLTFEYIGPDDVFGESPHGPRIRGSRCTSIDAAFLHVTGDGVTELVLVEWKYTESYAPRRPDPRKDEVRRTRYERFLGDPDGPVRADVLDLDHLLDEPLYQLVRQQLLAHELERSGVLGAERVRIVHVCPPANVGYQRSLTRPGHLAVGSTVSEVWSALVRRPDRFTSIDSAVFLDPAVTSDEYVARYGPG